MNTANCDNGTEWFRGTVKWFNTKKGYGFIEQPGADKDVFVHFSVLPDGVEALDEGQTVAYQVETKAKGIRACNLRLER